MQLHKTIRFLLVALVAFMAFSCGKDKDPEPTNADFLTASEWKGESVFIFGEDETDLFLELTGYDITKNSVKYEKNGTYTDRYERFSVNGTWEFTNNERSIIFDKGTDDEYTARVVRLNPTEYYLEIEFGTPEDPLPVEFRFKK